MVDWSYGVLFVRVYRVLADITGIVTEQCARKMFSELSSLVLCDRDTIGCLIRDVTRLQEFHHITEGLLRTVSTIPVVKFAFIL